jgi:threonine dehydrogenase-like Zn-dependent dehydrogenase
LYEFQSYLIFLFNFPRPQSKGDAVEQIIKDNGKLVDRAVDAVGYQAVGSSGDKEEPNVSQDIEPIGAFLISGKAVLTSLIRVVRPTGGLGIPGL